MAVYKWEGVARNGQIKSGKKEAANEQAILQFLRAQQIRPRRIRATKAGAGMDKLGNINITFGTGVTDKDLVVFARQFATMIDAGLPLVQCLDILSSQMVNPHFKKVVKEVQNEVEGGSTFADALKRHPKIFNALFSNLVAAGEVGGVLDVVLQRIAAYLEKAAKLKGQVKSALVYPAVIVSVAFIVVAVLLIFVIPIFQGMFASFGGAELPGPTQVVINISNWSQRNWYVIMGTPVMGFVAWKWIRKHPKGHALTDDLFLKAPIFGSLLRKVAVARFTRTLGTMVSSGVPILDALEITARTVGNMTVEKAINESRQSISEGKSIAEPISRSGVFPPMVCQMVNVGEQTGALDAMLGKIADFYDDEVDTSVKGLTSLIEPALMVFLGVVIGGIVIAMYLPIFKMAGALKAQ
jgi:type IV pilus assembly protein PilC